MIVKKISRKIILIKNQNDATRCKNNIVKLYAKKNFDGLFKHFRN